MGDAPRIARLLITVFIAAAVGAHTNIVFAEGAASSQSISSPVSVVPSAPVLTSTAPDIVMTAFSAGDKLDVIELYNQSATAISLADVSISTRDTTQKEQTISLQAGFLLSKHYVTFAADTNLIIGAVAFGTQQDATAGDIAKISIVRSGSVTQSVNVPPSTGNASSKDDYAWAQHKQRGNASVKQTGDFATDFVRKNTALSVEGTQLYRPMSTAGGLKIIEVHPNPMDCEPGGASALNLACGDYVKVFNDSAAAVNLTNYRLRAGAYGDSASITNTFNWHQSIMTPEDELWLNPYDSFVVHLRDDLKPLSLTATGKYIWVEDYFGTMTYSSVQYPDMTLSKYIGSSWAFDPVDATWKAGAPSPLTSQNVFPLTPADGTSSSVTNTVLAACAPNQYRSPDTNRCRSMIAAAPTTCKEGQYRSEETNRCRSIAQTVAASLKPCGDDQFRNPQSGRCKKIASMEDIVQPCDAGWERNPDTNRCRKVKITAMPLAAFPVQSIPRSSSHSAEAIGIAGVAAGALAYAVWEWRREVFVGARAMLRRLPFLR